ncbi:hypothetical protein AJ78_06912 [Emergomyces pasteurianus Ep9510]|uniref:Rhodopsin domain-containing protein n=1 Tax=Emergomyces pasteurianus Ep9510 TaxID=1447872 RepID=A0A1J9P8V7_9EURO|nr:hypothetical protein AJ78_06912 [Emergomyces pasteurianus Ep9510]
MRSPPLEVMATWPKPNYVNPEYQGPLMPVVGILFVCLSTIVLALRLWVRVHMKKSAGLDDWLMLATMPFIIAITVSTILGTRFGWGVHIWDNKPEWSEASRLTSWLSQLFFIIIMTLVKLSILASYVRISAGKKNKFNRLSWAVLALTVAWGVTFFIAVFTVCRPLKNYWENMYDKTCVDESSRILGATISNIITDLIVLILPIPTFWKLKLPIRERLVLISMMSLGLIAVAASVVRCWYMYVTTDLTYDVTWHGYTIWVWNAVEVNLAVICASIPTLRPFARKYIPRLGIKSTSPARSGPQSDSQEHSGIYKTHTIHKRVEHSVSTEQLNSEHGAYPMMPVKSYHKR